MTQKRLTREAYERARAFLRTQARPLERALFEHRFEGAPPGRVLEGLARFQNDDGGFGRALEPDVRTPSSSALATAMALHTLKDLRCPAGHPLVGEAVQYLLATFDEGAGVWRVLPPDASLHPHAPWWHDEAGSLERTFDGFRVIPRAEIVGVLLHYASLVRRDWLQALAERTLADAVAMDARQLGGGGDAFCYAMGLAEDLPQPLRDRLLAHLRSVVGDIVSRDPQQWGSYCAPPLKLAPTPGSAVADLLWDDLQVHLDYLIDRQTPEGAWEPNWSWRGRYPEAWEEARREWRGCLTLDALASLCAFGRVDA